MKTFFKRTKRRFKKAGYTLTTIWLNEDYPMIGSGQRRVWAKPGRKYVHVINPFCALEKGETRKRDRLRHAKIPLRDFARMAVQS